MIRFLLILLCIGTGLFAFRAPAHAETRSLRIYQVHTGERAVITFKRNGRYDRAGLKKLDYILRDWRKNQETAMDPRLMDLLWEVYQQSGSHDYIHIICGYRTADTNAMLRGRSRASGVAKKSQHILGKAADFFIPDVRLERLREIGMKFQVGGVGYYPNSGSPFVHMDTGYVRAWPRMSREQLVRLFPKGHTLHLPRDGKPLPGYEEALVSYKRRVTDDGIMVAGRSATGRRSGGGNLLAALFGGGGGDEDEPSNGDTVQANPKLRPIETAAMAPVGGTPPAAQPAVLLPAAAKVPLPGVRPTLMADAAPERGTSAAGALAAVDAADGGSSAKGATYPDLLAYAAPVPQLPPAADVRTTMQVADRADAPGTSPEATGSLQRSPIANLPRPAARPSLVAPALVAYAEPADDTAAPAFAAAVPDAPKAVKSAAGSASRRKLTKGAILMASLGRTPSAVPRVLSESRPMQDFATVSGKTIKGGRIGSGKTADAAAGSRLTREMIEAWAKANRRARLETVADNVPAPRMKRLSPALPERRKTAGGRIDPQRFAALDAYFSND